MPMQMQFSPRHNHLTIRRTDANGQHRSRICRANELTGLGGDIEALVHDAMATPSLWVDVPNEQEPMQPMQAASSYHALRGACRSPRSRSRGR